MRRGSAVARLFALFDAFHDVKQRKKASGSQRLDYAKLFPYDL